MQVIDAALTVAVWISSGYVTRETVAFVPVANIDFMPVVARGNTKRTQLYDLFVVRNMAVCSSEYFVGKPDTSLRPGPTGRTVPSYWITASALPIEDSP